MPVRAPLSRPSRFARGWAGTSPLLRLFAVNGALGVLVAFLILGVLLSFDVAGLWRLGTGSADGFIALALLAGGLCVTFAAAAIATAVMLLPEDGDDDGPGGPGERVLRPVPVRRDDHRRRF